MIKTHGVLPNPYELSSEKHTRRSLAGCCWRFSYSGSEWGLELSRTKMMEKVVHTTLLTKTIIYSCGSLTQVCF